VLSTQTLLLSDKVVDVLEDRLVVHSHILPKTARPRSLQAGLPDTRLCRAG
jgi:hypothetical protein